MNITKFTCLDNTLTENKFAEHTRSTHHQGAIVCLLQIRLARLTDFSLQGQSPYRQGYHTTAFPKNQVLGGRHIRFICHQREAPAVLQGNRIIDTSQRTVFGTVGISQSRYRNRATINHNTTGKFVHIADGQISSTCLEQRSIANNAAITVQRKVTFLISKDDTRRSHIFSDIYHIRIRSVIKRYPVARHEGLPRSVGQQEVLRVVKVPYITIITCPSHIQWRARGLQNQIDA